MSVQLYNANAFPFGRLSNNYQDTILIDDTRYQSVTHYILSNMLQTPIYRSIIKRSKLTNNKCTFTVSEIDIITQLLSGINSFITKSDNDYDSQVKFKNSLNFCILFLFI